MKTVSVQVSDNIHNQLKILCAAEWILHKNKATISGLIRTAIEQQYNFSRYKIDIKERDALAQSIIEQKYKFIRKIK